MTELARIAGVSTPFCEGNTPGIAFMTHRLIAIIREPKRLAKIGRNRRWMQMGACRA
jgi:hypothetical protein